MVFDIQWIVADEVQLHRRFVRLETALDDFSEPLTDAMGVIEEEAEHQFASEGEPRWPLLSKAYERRKRRIWGDKPILQASGALFLSLVKRTARGAIAVVTKTEMRRGTSLQVGTRRKWNLGLIHQVGAPRASIPARAMMRLRSQAQAKIVNLFHSWFFQQGEGAAP